MTTNPVPATPRRRTLLRAAAAPPRLAARGVAAAARYLWTRPRHTKLKFAGAAAFALALVLAPFDQGETGVVLLPTDGTEMTLPQVLAEGKLYKLTVGGTYIGAGDGRRYDAEYVTESDPYDTPRSSVVVDDRLAAADLKDEVNHRYTYYVGGRGRPLRVRLLDWMVKGGPEGAYFDNQGYLEVTLEEADFRFAAGEDPQRVAIATVIRYSLDPRPRPRDVVKLEIFARDEGGGRTKVFEATSDAYLDATLGFPLTLAKEPRASFTWYNVANVGPGAFRPVAAGLYDVSLSVQAGDDVYYAFPPDVKSRFLTIAVLPRSSDPRLNPQPVIATDAKGRRAFPYYSPRAAHPILGPIGGVENIYVPGQKISRPTFLYYSPAGPEGPIASAAVYYLKRTINLALATAAECDPTFVYEPMRNISGVYDDALVAKMVELRTRLPYDTSAEERILDEVDNLPPDRGYAASPVELGRIIGAPTVEHLMNLKFTIDGFPAPLPLREFDNYDAYNEKDPYHSLYHAFWEVGRRVAGEKRRFGPPPASGEPTPGKRYDPSDADFVALLMAVSYQECGFVHTLADGVCYRVGRGRGSATGYLQCTADLIHGTNYKITFPAANGLVATRLNRLPYNSRYAVRNVARFNVEIGAQFLREVIDQADAASYGRDFARATAGDGVLSWATTKGAVNRAKLAGAMYNAGPGAMKVILTEVYDDPKTPDRNEGIDFFLNDCGGDLAPFLARFRADLYEYSRGRKKFPIQKKGPEGNARVEQLLHWLGPFWYKKGDGAVSWEEAALIKIDREVIPYVDGVGTNFLLFRAHDAYYFKAANFAALWQRPGHVASLEDAIRPRRPIRKKP